MSNLKFQVECKQTKPGEEVYIIGNSSELGNWNVNNSKKLKTNSNLFPIWETNPISFQSKSKLEYKYIIKGNSNLNWENFDGNRTINLSSLEDQDYIVNDGKFGNKSKQTINKSYETLANTSHNASGKKVKIVKKKSKVNNQNHNHNNYQYSNTNADEYVESIGEMKLKMQK